jgi:Omp85 superfamily domain
MNRCASLRVRTLQLGFVLVASFPLAAFAQEYTELTGEAPERKADPAPTTVASAEPAKGFEEILFIVHKAAALIARPGLELGWKAHLLGTGGGPPGGFSGNIGGSGPKSGTGITLGYVYYNNPFWAGIDGAVTYKGYTNDYVFVGVTDPKYNNFLRARVDYDLDRHDEFSGLGMETELDQEDGGSPENEETDYYQEEIRVMGEGQVRLSDVTYLGGRGGYRKNNILKGKNEDIPDITKVFAGVPLPGVGILPGVSDENANYTQVGGYFLVDTRDVPGNPGRGVLLGGGYDSFRGVDDTPFDWDRWTGEFAGYLPLPDASRVIAVRIFGVHQDPKNGETLVPYYVLSSIGGPKALRSYDSQRFQDNDQLYTGIEYRRRVWSDPENRFGIDAALVAESAAVYRDMFDKFDLGDMKQSFGTEVRLLTPNNNDLRMGASFGDEGGKFFISGGGRF